MAAKAIASLVLLVASQLTPHHLSCHAFNVAAGLPTASGRQQCQSTALLGARNPGIIVDTEPSSDDVATSSRRQFMNAMSSMAFAAAVVLPSEGANAAQADCFQDCLKNCKLIAPKDPQYCQGNCREYCDQPDRTDGLSGSVSSEGGETGILGTNTVVKGEDRPPRVNLPGLDFTSDSGKKLLGY